MARKVAAAAMAALAFGTAAIADDVDDEWRRSLEADVSNGAPKETICDNALRRAGISNDVGFKNYAYGVVRKLCPEMLSGGKAFEPPKPEPLKLPPQLEALKSEGCEMVINGWRPPTCGGGPNLRTWSGAGGR